MKENLLGKGYHTTIDDEGAIMRVYIYRSTVYPRSGGGGLSGPAAGDFLKRPHNSRITQS